MTYTVSVSGVAESILLLRGCHWSEISLHTRLQDVFVTQSSKYSMLVKPVQGTSSTESNMRKMTILMLRTILFIHQSCVSGSKSVGCIWMPLDIRSELRKYWKRWGVYTMIKSYGCCRPHNTDILNVNVFTAENKWFKQYYAHSLYVSVTRWSPKRTWITAGLVTTLTCGDSMTVTRKLWSGFKVWPCSWPYCNGLWVI